MTAPEWIDDATATCGHGDLLGFLISAPCALCTKEGQEMGLYPDPIPEPPF